jgi:hypothetical protein
MGSEEPSPQASRRGHTAPAAPVDSPAPGGPPDPAAAPDRVGAADPAGMVEPVDAVEPVGAEVEASRGEGRWSVARNGWQAVVPDLPEECAALLATPIVVSVEASSDGDRGGEDDDEEEPVGRHRASAGRYEYRPTLFSTPAVRPRPRHRV